MKALRSSFFVLLSFCIGATITTQTAFALSDDSTLPTAASANPPEPAQPADSARPAEPAQPGSDTAPSDSIQNPPAATPVPPAPATAPQKRVSPTSTTPNSAAEVPSAADSRPRDSKGAHHSNADQDDDDEGDHADANAGLGDRHVGPGQTVHDVVSVFGNSLAESPVDGAVVGVFGDSEARENVSQAVVAVFGDVSAEKNVGESAVAVFGDVYVNGHVNENVVAVFGDIHLGPKAIVEGDVVSVGGALHRDPGAVIRGHITASPGRAPRLHLAGFSIWLRHCVFTARLLAFRPELSWAWIVAVVFLGLYSLVALLFSRGVTRCAETFEQRPGWTILATLITVVLTPVLLILLTVTVFGAFFLALALLIGAFFGKAAFYAWVGRRFYRVSTPEGTALAVLIGGAIAVLLFTVPVIGLVLWLTGGALGLGMVVYTLVLSMKRPPAVAVKGTPIAPLSVATPAPIVPVVGRVIASPPEAIPAPSAETLDAAKTPAAATVPVEPLPSAIPAPTIPNVPPPHAAAVYVSASTLPRAGFGIRLAAAALDMVIVSLLAHLLHLGGWFLLLYTVYCVAMWCLKSTTVGGIICGLKLVRLDDRPIDWTIATIRALGAFLSAVVFGLGFIWVIFDDQSQSWHDKIAGTTIVMVPKSIPLV